jgi:hypothetical protein
MSIYFIKTRTTEDGRYSTPNQLYITFSGNDFTINLPESLNYTFDNGNHTYRDASGTLVIWTDNDFTVFNITYHGSKIDLHLSPDQTRKVKEELDTLVRLPQAAPIQNSARSTENSRRGGHYEKYLKYKSKYLSLKNLL